VLAIGFILVVSLAVSAWIAALGAWSASILPAHELILHILNFIISFLIINLSTTLRRFSGLNGVGVSSGRFGIVSSEHDGARVEPAGAARVRGSFPCHLRRTVPLEATDGKAVLASLHGPVPAPYHPSLAG
jgi:hypothetical protein